MTYVVYQKIGSRVYVYEAEAYYDKEKKQARQKRKYLGRVAPETGEIIPKRTTKIRVALDYGDVAFVYQSIIETGLYSILNKVYGKEITNILTALIIYKIVEPMPLVRIERWYDRTYLRDTEVGLSSQNISRVLACLGDDYRTHQDFFAEWISKWGKELIVFYDITSMESAVKLNELLEYGYTRSGENLMQLNFGLVLNYENSLPLYYKIFPGSLPDVRTLKNMMIELQSYGINHCFFILDRGFYSLQNIYELHNNKMDFLMPMPFTTKISDDIISKHKKDLELPENAVKYDDEVLYIKKDKIKLNGIELSYLLYYDKEKEAIDTNRFYKRMFEIEDRLKKIRKFRWPVNDVVEEIAGKYKSYLDRELKNGKIVTVRKSEAISKYLNRLGKTILITNRHDLTWLEMLDYYKAKDDIEKLFRTIKSDLEGLPMRTDKKETTLGYLFVLFLSSIVTSYIRRKMRASEINLSLPELLLELSKIRKMILYDGKEIISELTREQKSLVNALNLNL